MGGRNATFAEIAHTIFITEKKYSAHEAAAALDLKYDALYSRLCGRVAFRPEEIRALIKIAPDQRLADFLLTETEFIAVDRARPGFSPTENISKAMNRITLEAAEILRELERALGDGKICHVDKLRIHIEVEDTERALAALRARLDSQ